MCIGASAGGVPALRRLVAQLPADLPAAVLVVLHLPARSPSVLPAILDRAGSLPSHAAVSGQPLRAGTVVVAPPGRHLEVHDGAVRLTTGPKEHGHRPSIDVLLRSAARSHGAAVVGVVLSGTLDDGTAGLLEVRRRGGGVLVQDPADATYPDMPLNAIQQVQVDHVLGAEDLGRVLGTLPPSGPGGGAGEEGAVDHGDSTTSSPSTGSVEGVAEPSDLMCPDCGGSLRVAGRSPLRFRCRTGHAWGSHSLLQAQDDEAEAALWTAVRVLSEKGDLLKRLAGEAREQGRGMSADRFEREAGAALQAVTALHRMLLVGGEADGARSPEQEVATLGAAAAPDH